MRLIYLAGPYFHKDEKVRQKRLRGFEDALAYFMNTARNLCMYSPIVHWSNIATRHDLPHNAAFWLQQDFFMIKQASAMWVLTMEGWKDSYGLSQELEYAHDIGRDVVYVVKDEGSFFLCDESLARTTTIT